MLLKADNFTSKNTAKLARGLLGMVLARKMPDGSVRRGIITEVEAYDGAEDGACHARHGRTARNAPMFGSAGHWYVYFVYGCHQMLNLVTGPKEYPAAILIRGIATGPKLKVKSSKSTIPEIFLDGPGKVTKWLEVDRALSGLRASKKTGLWLEEGSVRINPKRITALPRVGINYAPTEWREKPWRFVLKM